MEEFFQNNLKEFEMRYPNTIDKNIYLAYIRKENVQRKSNSLLEATNLNWDLNLPESLVELSIKTIAENWSSELMRNQKIRNHLFLILAYPFFSAIPVCENRCLLADILDVETLPLTELCTHVRDDEFWKRMFKAKWPNLFNNTKKPGKRWIEIYIEKFLGESLENLKPSEYNVEKIKSLAELCSPFVKYLRIGYLEAATESHDATSNHVPFDIILEHLNELKCLSITYDCKTIGTQFYLGCTTITLNDITKFVRGLSHTDLEEFEFHSSKLEPHMLKLIARSLDKTTSLTTISMANCRFGDTGLTEFIKVMTHDSLPNVKHICLRNNFISSEGATLLANILRRRKIETIDLKLNPILAEGAIHILALVDVVGLVNLNLSSCSFDGSIVEYLEHVLKFNRTLRDLNLSINRLGEELGQKVSKIIGHNPIIRVLDIRNTEMSLKTKSAIDALVLENREKKNTISQ